VIAERRVETIQANPTGQALPQEFRRIRLSAGLPRARRRWQSKTVSAMAPVKAISTRTIHPPVQETIHDGEIH
jgi:hypothetical protein